MKKSNTYLEDRSRPNLTPMIDVVFLLLIFFLVTTAIMIEEGDLSIQLPGAPNHDEPQKVPNEAVVNILADATITMNGMAFDHYDSRTMPQLTEALRRLKAAGDAGEQVTFVTIQADPDSPHQRSIDVLNACTGAGIRNATFGNG